MTTKVLVVDDEPLARERVAGFVHFVAPDAAIDEAIDGAAAIDQIRSLAPDVVFLDVQMPGRSGFDVIAAIGADAMPATVFVTAFDQHAIRAFEVAAVDYLLKPFDEKRFRTAWNRVTAHRSARALVAESQRFAVLVASIGGGVGRRDVETNPARPSPASRILVKKNQRTLLVRPEDIEWIEASGNNVVLHCGRDRHSLRETLASIEARLDPQRFVRIHRRTIVAIDAIREIQPWFSGDQVLILKTGGQLKISRSYRAAATTRIAGAPR